ncbi:MAG: penicillin acylase family protein [Sinobacteraceae bacterium]|nr:penicillin acylase family protein [Nevskiaceae bacterium]
MPRWFRHIVLSLPLVAGLLLLSAWLLLRGSLPQLDGESSLPGLTAPATIQRDALGVVSIDAANATDLARALGYVHAQERFFEMDLMRRSAAGELAELFGPVALPLDQQRRAHRMRARIGAHTDSFAGEHRAELQAYADGVNAGLAALPIRPWPYLLLRQPPRRWQIADSALVGLAMYFDLQDSRNARELALWKLQPLLPPALFALLVRDGTTWDAPLSGSPRGDAALPGADEVDLRTLPMPGPTMPARFVEPLEPGSNNWAVAGALTADGRAIVANDMHLGLRVPNLWFRARLRYIEPGAPPGDIDIAGFTLPGLPAVIVGSNRRVAWGFTNGYTDNADWLALPKDDPGIVEYHERIRVAGQPAVDLTVRESAWGPILAEHGGQVLALRWTAQLPGAVRFDFAALAQARDLDQAFAVADRAGMPAQNFIVADAGGRIGWRLIGARPQRDQGCGDPSTVLTGHCKPWSIEGAAAPELIDPATHRLWTANNRVVDGDALRALGDGGYVLGARARQIREALFARDRFDEGDLLALQLDDRALFLERWWQFLQSLRERGPALATLATAARDWEGRATPDAVSYRIVRAWRLAVRARIAGGLLAPARVALGDDFEPPVLPQLEGVLWPLLQQRPAHLLPRRHTCAARMPSTTPSAAAGPATAACEDASGWDRLLEEAAREVRDGLGEQGPLEQRRWGERNTARICHPLAAILPPPLRRALCMPTDELAGDVAMPRVASPDFGASQRMVVSPGHEDDGIAHMPGGQSGHPLSPFWGAGHEAWVKGEPTPFLPGQTMHRLRLTP